LFVKISMKQQSEK